MNQAQRKFIQRAPRYVLRADDDQLMRFAPKEEKGHSFTTRFLNISATGLAFLIDKEYAPRVGDVLKVEFPLSESQRVAWFARTVRVHEYRRQNWWSKEDIGADDVLVGLQFLELPDQHRRAIEKALDEKFLQIVKQQRSELYSNLARAFAENFWRIMVWVMCAIATFAALYYLSRPTLNYDEKRGAPWGERFKFW